jgi:protein TonB
LPDTVGRRRSLLVAALIAVALHAALLGALARWPVVPPPSSAPASPIEISLTTAAPAPPEAPVIATPTLTPVAPAAPKPETAAPPETTASPSEKTAESSSSATSTPQSAGAASPSKAAKPSGRALLAQATDRVQRQGFTAPDAEQADDPLQRGAVQRYIDAWSRRVESYGNRHHPAPAALEGQLRIRAVIGREGQLRQAEVIQSSGHPELDQAALQTVRDAAPYRPFDRGMGQRDSLTITRTWRFGKGNSFGVR